MQLEVLKFYRHARTDEQWLEDPSPTGSPAVQLALASPEGILMVRQWLVADPFGDEVRIGRAGLAFQRAPAASMCEDFTDPPNADGNADGILSMHYMRPDVPDSRAGKRGKESRCGEE